MAEGFNEVAPIEYDRSKDKLIEEYKTAYKDVLAAIVELISLGDQADIYQKQTSTLRQIEVILSQLDESTKLWCENEIKLAFVNGQAAALVSTGAAATLSEAYVLMGIAAGAAQTLAEAVQGVQFSMIAQHTVDALIQDTYTDLLAATNHTNRKVKQIVRQTVGDVIRQRAITRHGRKTITKDLVNNLTKQGLTKTVQEDGFVGIIDKAGRKWDLNRYAEMVTRTKLLQAHTEGVRVKGLERGQDLGVISSHNAPDLCGGYEGMIVSMNGLTPGLFTYEQLRQANEIFHPNCGHNINLINLKYFPQALKDKHDRKVAAFKSKKLDPPILVKDIKEPSREEVRALNVELSAV